MNAAYLRKRAALDAYSGDLIDVTGMGMAAPQYVDNSPTPESYITLAQRSYVLGELSLEELEAELARIL